MDYRKHISTGISALLVAVLAIMAFIRGELQIWLLGGAFLLWGMWALIPLCLNAKRKRDYQRKKQQQAQQKKQFVVPTLDEASKGPLQWHVGCRISAYLQSAYPTATWEWCEKDPERIINQGGTARIKLFDVPDFNYANIIFDKKANIGCDMMRIVPLAEVSGMPVGTQVQPPQSPKQPADPQVWYEMQGRSVLENLIADLHSRGHSSLTIKDNGDICIKQDNAEVTAKTLKNLPSKIYWQALVKVFEKEGLAAAVTDAGIAVTW